MRVRGRGVKNLVLSPNRDYQEVDPPKMSSQIRTKPRVCSRRFRTASRFTTSKTGRPTLET